VRRFATTALSLCLLLGLSGAHLLLAQDDPKKDEQPKSEPSKTEAPKPEASKDKEKDKSETTKPDASASAEALAPIPPEVEAKLEAARRAVAEAIVAAQDAGLVKTTIEPPPVLEILITGRANDANTFKAKLGVSPEVFGAWFTGYGVPKDINPEKDVRIIRPSDGLKELFDQRATVLNRHIEAVRQAQGSAKKDAPKEEAAKEGNKEAKKEAPKEDEAKKDGEGANQPKDDAKKDDKKGDGSKDDAPK